MTERTDILIVGGGLVGASLALALDAAGRNATLLEANLPRGGTQPTPVEYVRTPRIGGA